MKAFLFVFVFFCCGCVAMLLSLTDLHVCLELGCKLGFFSVPVCTRSEDGWDVFQR